MGHFLYVRLWSEQSCLETVCNDLERLLSIWENEVMWSCCIFTTQSISQGGDSVHLHKPRYSICLEVCAYMSRGLCIPTEKGNLQCKFHDQAEHCACLDRRQLVHIIHLVFTLPPECAWRTWKRVYDCNEGLWQNKASGMSTQFPYIYNTKCVCANTS